MSEVRVVAMGPDRFGVEVEEGHVRTTHKVAVSNQFLDDTGLSDVSRDEIVREAFEFLLEREPANSILGDFPIEQISVYFPEFVPELRTRLGL